MRPAKIRPALKRLQDEFGREYALVAPNLATDGVDVLWDFSRMSEGQGLMDGANGQLVMREIVQDYLRYVVGLMTDTRARCIFATASHPRSSLTPIAPSGSRSSRAAAPVCGMWRTC